jgi:hypothetical protein
MPSFLLAAGGAVSAKAVEVMKSTKNKQILYNIGLLYHNLEKFINIW